MVGVYCAIFSASLEETHQVLCDVVNSGLKRINFPCTTPAEPLLHADSYDFAVPPLQDIQYIL